MPPRNWIPANPDTYWGQLGIDTDTVKIHGRNLPGDTRTLEITGLHPGRAYQYGIATRYHQRRRPTDLERLAALQRH